MNNNPSIKINAILNTIRQLCSVLFPLITVPYITRVLGADYYGRVNWVYSIVSYFVLLAGFGISTYAVREGARIREDANKISTFSNEVFSINVLSSLFSCLLLLTLTLFWHKLHDNIYLVLIQSLVIFFTTIGADWINQIYEDYKYLTIRYIVMQIMSVVLMFVFVKDSKDYLVYAFITILASAGGNLLNIVYIRRYIHLRIVLYSDLKKHLKPMLVLFANSVAIITYLNTDITLLGIFKTNEDVGIYSVASKIYIIVKQLINALIVVSLPRLSQLIGNNDDSHYHELLNKIINSVLLVLIPTITGLFALSENIIYIIAGSNYVSGTLSLRILSFSLFFAVFACFFQNCIMLPQNLEKQFFVATIASCLLNFGLNLVIIPIFSFNGAAITTLASELLVCVICYLYSKSNINISVDFNSIFSVIVGSALVYFECFFISHYFNNQLMIIIISIFLGIALYLFVLKLFSNTYLNSLFSFFKRVKE